MEAQGGPASEAEVFINELNACLGAGVPHFLPPREGPEEAPSVSFLNKRLAALRHENVGLRVELQQERENATREIMRLRQDLMHARGERGAANRAADAPNAGIPRRAPSRPGMGHSRGRRLVGPLLRLWSALARSIWSRWPDGEEP